MPRSSRTYPHVQNIKDTDTRMSMQKNWDETHNQAESLSALQSQIATLQSTVESLQATVSKLQGQITQAIVPSGQS